MAKIAGKEVDFRIDNYAVRQFGLAVGAKDPMEAMQKLSLLSKGFSFEAQEVFAQLIYWGCDEKITLRECYDEILNQEFLLEVVVPEVNRYTQAFVDLAETKEVKKKKEEVTA